MIGPDAGVVADVTTFRLYAMRALYLLNFGL